MFAIRVVDVIALLCLGFIFLFFVILPPLANRREAIEKAKQNPALKVPGWGYVLLSMGLNGLILVSIFLFGAVFMGMWWQTNTLLEEAAPNASETVVYVLSMIIAAVLFMGLGVLLTVFVSLGCLGWAVYRILPPFYAGEYEKSLGRAAWHLNHNPVRFFDKGFFLLLQGEVYLYAGDYESAQAVFQACINVGDATSNSKKLNLYNGFVGMSEAKLATKYFDETYDYLEKATQMFPSVFSAYAALTEFYLAQNQPEDALIMAEKALLYRKTNFLSRILEQYRWSRLHANKAWALALIGKHKKIDNALDTAFQEARSKSPVVMADLYYRIGQIEIIRGDSESAISYFQHTLELDPHGRAGTLAQQALMAI